jgi:segregation and condensation protein B
MAQLSPIELRNVLEAILFVAGEPVRLDAFVEAFPDEGAERIQEQLKEIELKLTSGEFGFLLEQAAGGYRFATKPDVDPYLRRFFSKQGEGRLSIAALETLAMVAYKQPITAPEISDIRGVNSSGVLRTLLERRLIRIAGRKNVVGSPFLYKTTREFLLHFGLNSIQDLPRLEEFAEILGENLGEELLGGSGGSEEGDSETMQTESEQSVASDVEMTEGVEDAGSTASDAVADEAGEETAPREEEREGEVAEQEPDATDQDYGSRETSEDHR